MAKYTTELLSVIQMYSSEGKPLNDRIDEAANYLMAVYPIWEEAYRTTLNRKILRHYIDREIAAETVGRWKMWLETRMYEIMPYYNQLYLTTLEKFDGSNDVDLIITNDNDTLSHLEQVGTGKNVDKTEALGTDYPQGTVAPGSNLYYGSEGQESTTENTANTTSKAESTGKETGTQTRKGRSGVRTQGDLITAFRNAIINIDLLIIRDLKDLFFTLY